MRLKSLQGNPFLNALLKFKNNIKKLKKKTFGLIQKNLLNVLP